LFGLGLTAYRLVTDEYPPLTDPEESGAEVWREGGPGPQAPSELNPRVSPELDALILRLLARDPEERFGGEAWKAAEALERARREAEARADSLLFGWDVSPAPRWRSPKRVRLAEEQDAAARQEAAQRVVEENPRAVTNGEQGRRRIRNPLLGEEMAVSMVGLLFAMLTVAALYRGQEVTRKASGAGGGDIVAVGDSASGAAVSELAPMRTDSMPLAVGLPMPENPFPGQRTPPCNRVGEVTIRGGCWYELARAKPPCKEVGKEDAYHWQGACYLPAYPHGRQPTSQPP
jgi:hypothetical protein